MSSVRVCFCALSVVLTWSASGLVLADTPPEKNTGPAIIETSTTLQASRILPPELIKGPNFQVAEQVANDGFLNTYSIRSPYGDFNAVSTDMLRVRITEINAIAIMDKIKGSDAYAKSVKEAGVGVYDGLKNMVTHPVDTVSGAVSGVGKLLSRAEENVLGGKRSQAEDARVKDLIGFSKTKRDYAYQFGVDVYSSNTKLQDELNAVAWAGYAGGLSVTAATAAVTGGAAATVLTVSGSSHLLEEVLRDTAPADLRKMNREKLRNMGVTPDVADLYIDNTVYTPRNQTALVAALEQMQGVPGRAAIVKLAVLAPNDNVAYFRQRQAEMYAGFNSKVAPVTGFSAIGQTAAARTADGALVFCVPVDHLLWTSEVASIANGAAASGKGQTGVKARHLWVSGTASETARKQLEAQGWVVHERADLLLLASGQETGKETSIQAAR